MNGRISLPVICLGIFGFGILYVPIAVMIVFSFNAGKLVSVWSGFSAKWYASLITNEQLLNAFGLSLFIAFWAATIATFVGMLIAIAFVRFGDFRGRLALALVNRANGDARGCHWVIAIIIVYWHGVSAGLAGWTRC